MVKFLAFSCPHFRIQDNEAISKLLDGIALFKPDVIVHMGDGHEADSATKWPSSYTFTLEDEYTSHNGFLRSIRKISPHSRKVFLPGNHEDNLINIHRANKKTVGLLSWQRRENEPELFDHWEKPVVYKYDRNSGVFRLGQVSFYHGFEASQSSDEMQSIILGLPYGLSCSGHTHRPVEVTRASKVSGVPLPYWYANSGCLLDMDVEYMRRKRRHLWGHGYIIGSTTDWRYSKTMMPNRKEWDAETVILKMYNDV